MSKIFNDYLVGSEREDAITEAYFNNLFAKLDTMYEMISMQYDQMVRDAEYKVFSESGTYDDLSFYMQEAGDETGEDKRNILQKIADGISALIKKIVDGIKGLFGKGNPDDDVEIDTGVTAAANAIKAKANELNAAFRESNILKAITTLGGIAIAGFAVKKTGVVEKVKRKALESDCEFLHKIIDGIDNLVNKVKSFLPKPEAKGAEDNTKSGLSILQKIASAISTVVANIKNALFDKFGKDKKAGENGEGAQQNSTANDQQQSKTSSFETEKFAGRQNAVSLINMNGFKWKVDKNNGHVTRINANGVEEDIPENQLPDNIRKLAQRAKGKAAMQVKGQADQAALNNKFGKKVFNNKHAITVDKKTGKIYQNIDGTVKEVSPTMLQSIIPDKKVRDNIINQVNKIRNKRNFNNSVHESAEIEKALTDAGFSVTLEDVADSNEFISICYDIYTEGCMIEETESDYIISSMSNKCENYVESTTKSIFGYDESELKTESVDFDQELEELSNLFSNI